MEKEYTYDTYEGQKHFEIIFETGEKRAICNPKQIKKPSKLTDDWEKVTCGNCLLKKNKIKVTEGFLLTKDNKEVEVLIKEDVKELFGKTKNVYPIKKEYQNNKDYEKIMGLKEQLDKIPDDEI